MGCEYQVMLTLGEHSGPNIQKIPSSHSLQSWIGVTKDIKSCVSWDSCLLMWSFISAQGSFLRLWREGLRGFLSPFVLFSLVIVLSSTALHVDPLSLIWVRNKLRMNFFSFKEGKNHIQLLWFIFLIFLIGPYLINICQWIRVWNTLSTHTHTHTNNQELHYRVCCYCSLILFLHFPWFLYIYLSPCWDSCFVSENCGALGRHVAHVFTATGMWPSTFGFLPCYKAWVCCVFPKAKKADFRWKQTCLLRGGKVHGQISFISREFAKYFLVGNIFFDEKEIKGGRKEGHSGIFHCHCVFKNNNVWKLLLNRPWKIKIIS